MACMCPVHSDRVARTSGCLVPMPIASRNKSSGLYHCRAQPSADRTVPVPVVRPRSNRARLQTPRTPRITSSTTRPSERELEPNPEPPAPACRPTFCGPGGMGRPHALRFCGLPRVCRRLGLVSVSVRCIRCPSNLVPWASTFRSGLPSLQPMRRRGLCGMVCWCARAHPCDAHKGHSG
jgi:hypothetical protein